MALHFLVIASQLIIKLGEVLTKCARSKVFTGFKQVASAGSTIFGFNNVMADQ
ncbi:hypothetical protein HMPREF0557_02040 [Listeria innocua ATCC 33091]|uniref:Uncharacterized protein n=1 Tax=Listeria innocua ATCC 33091 TaxID=1002366 RepID=A0AB72Z925_LISIO|nr:hypothetical protein HMPREF0557_02040 [Listeria innocua ATCC 33091]